jgi:hypothetical protein
MLYVQVAPSDHASGALGKLRLTPSSCAHNPQLLIPAELSHDAIDAIGEIGQLQFKDLNADKSVFQRTYANQVRSTLRAGHSVVSGHLCHSSTPWQRRRDTICRSSAPMRWHGSCASSTTRCSTLAEAGRARICTCGVAALCC